jgi:hypothetical protein
MIVITSRCYAARDLSRSERNTLDLSEYSSPMRLAVFSDRRADIASPYAIGPKRRDDGILSFPPGQVP